MNALFSGKNLPEVTIAMLIVAVILMFASIFTAASGVKKAISAYKESASIPVAIPLLAISIQPYTKAEYDIVQAKIKPAGGVKVESSGDKLTITSLDVMNEQQWSNAVTEALSIDKNLHAQRVCGGDNSACSGVALLAEVVGERKLISIKE